MTFPVPIFAACKPGIFLAKILPPPVGSCKRQFLPFIRKRSGSNSRFEPNHVIKSNRSAMMYSARCFRCFLRKSRVVRRDAMKSKLFNTINGVFCRFCASRNVLLFAELRFFSRAVNSNYGFIFPGDGERMR